MEIETSIAIQSVLIVLAFIVTVLRCFIRLFIEQRSLTVPDYLVWGGWACAAGWFVCSIKALRIQLHTPLIGEELMSSSVDYLITVFVASYFFDVGLFFPKASLMAFYWWLIPQGFNRLRIAVYICMGVLASAFLATVLTDTLIAPNISDNWTLETQMDSVWNSYTAFLVCWILNITTDLMLFSFPFFLIGSLSLRRRQMIGLIGVFSLGIITMVISLARFTTYTVTDFNVGDASGNTWCTAELCTAVIVVSLPALKPLIVRSSPTNTVCRSTNGYIQAGSNHPFSQGAVMSRSHIQGGKMDDELELVFVEQKSGANPNGSTHLIGIDEVGDNVIVTTNVTITRESV